MLKIIGWLLIIVQMMAYIGSFNVGSNPILLPLVGFIGYNLFAIMGIVILYMGKDK